MSRPGETDKDREDSQDNRDEALSEARLTGQYAGPYVSREPAHVRLGAIPFDCCKCGIRRNGNPRMGMKGDLPEFICNLCYDRLEDKGGWK